MSLESPLVTSEVSDGVGVIRLNDPARRNALSPELSNDLARAVEAVLGENVGAIVLTAEGSVFSAGGSLDALLSRELPLAASYAGFTALSAAPVPTIAAVATPAIGAGVNLPLACDIILTAPSARFDPRWLDVGIHPGGGHLWQLAQRIGVQGAAALVLCGDVLDGEQAAAKGLAWRCVPEPELHPLAMKFAARAAGRSRALVRRTKTTLQATPQLTTSGQALALELEAQEWSMDQPGFADRVREIQASLTARKPR
ncbi:MAG: Enoyl-CoA hydratase/isomerase [Mycobacterium sp.]|nr:Enoyl-CoA hydratase/isomerase [Mycobacterium sp.]